MHVGHFSVQSGHFITVYVKKVSESFKLPVALTKNETFSYTRTRNRLSPKFSSCNAYYYSSCIENHKKSLLQTFGDISNT